MSTYVTAHVMSGCLLSTSLRFALLCCHVCTLAPDSSTDKVSMTFVQLKSHLNQFISSPQGVPNVPYQAHDSKSSKADESQSLEPSLQENQLKLHAGDVGAHSSPGGHGATSPYSQRPLHASTIPLPRQALAPGHVSCCCSCCTPWQVVMSALSRSIAVYCHSLICQASLLDVEHV